MGGKSPECQQQPVLRHLHAQSYGTGDLIRGALTVIVGNQGLVAIWRQWHRARAWSKRGRVLCARVGSVVGAVVCGRLGIEKLVDKAS